MDVETLYHHHALPLLRFVYSRVGSHEEAEDICSQVWMAALMQDFDDRTPHAWLYAVAHSRIIDRYRRWRRRSELYLGEWRASYDGGMGRVEELASLPRIDLRALTPRQRAVIELRFFEDYSIEQTAQTLCMTIGAVKSAQKRALARIGAMLMQCSPAA